MRCKKDREKTDNTTVKFLPAVTPEARTEVSQPGPSVS